jgi:hypothetical protein
MLQPREGIDHPLWSATTRRPGLPNLSSCAPLASAKGSKADENPFAQVVDGPVVFSDPRTPPSEITVTPPVVGRLLA